jgi:hypothetical protein
MKKIALILLGIASFQFSAFAISGVLKQSTAANVTVVKIDSTDHVTGKTGLTLTIKASKAAASFATVTPTVTELEGGIYKLAFTTSHTDTLGELRLRVTSTGADESDPIWQVVSLLPGDGVTVGTNNDKTGYSLSQTFPSNFSSLSIDGSGRVDVIKIAGTTQTARDIGASVLLAASQHVIVDSGTVTTLTNLPSIPANWLTASGIAAGALNGKGDWLLSSSYTAPPSAATIATTIWQDLTSSGDFTTTGSIGKLFTTDIDAAISSRSTYSGGDTSGTTTLLTRIPSALTITTGKVDVNDKTGFSLTSGERTSIWATLVHSKQAGELLWRVASRPSP